MDDDQLLRYSRQVLLPEIGIAGQSKLLESRVLIVGAGGLGSAASLYLAAAGVGTLAVADFDRVDSTNLQRQILFRQQDIGKCKVAVAKETLSALNPDLRVIPLAERLEGDQLLQQVQDASVVVDASDNYETRFAINKACLQSRTPLVSGAAIRMEGQISTFRADKEDSPCYRCLYPEIDDTDQTCAENGVLAPVVGIIGSMQGLEAIKIIADLGTELCGRLLLFDGHTSGWKEVRLRQDPDCPACGKTGKGTA